MSLHNSRFLAFLGRLVLAWEEGRYELIKSSPIDLIRSLMAENGLRQADLVGPVFPSRSRASEILAGKRRLTDDYVRK